MRKGVFYGVGVGPGDPELMTLKAVRLLERCRVVAAPQTKNGEMLALRIAAGAVDLKGKTVVPLSFSMNRDPAVLEQTHQRAARTVAEFLDQGEDVAMLNLGDVSIYATCSYLAELLRGQGDETVMIAGVPSFCASAARLGVSLTEIDQGLHILPGSADTEAALALPGTKVLMKSGRQLPAILRSLESCGLLAESMLVENCGLPDEAVYQDLSRERPPEHTGYFATLIVRR